MSATTAKFSLQDLNAVKESARTHAFERYLSALLAPQAYRQDLIALAAFVGDVERIPLVVTDPNLGEIRCRWWLDWLSDQAGDRTVAQRTGNPVADVFADVIARHKLPIGVMQEMVEARAYELYAEPFENRESFKSFLSSSGGGSFELAHRILSADDPDLDGDGAVAAVREYGMAYGCAVQLVRLPMLAVRGRWGLFADGEMIDATAMVDKAVRARADIVRNEVIDYAREALAAARSSAQNVKGLKPAALLPAALVEPYVKVLEGQTDWLRDQADISPLNRVWRIWSKSWSAKV